MDVHFELGTHKLLELDSRYHLAYQGINDNDKPHPVSRITLNYWGKFSCKRERID
jgi:hypothetical protein